MKKFLFLLSVIGCVAVACDKLDFSKEDEAVLDFDGPAVPQGNVKEIPREDVYLTKAQEDLAAGSVDFSIRMIRVADKVMEGYIVLSPLSVSLALSMLANGAAGDTRQEMVDALGFPGADVSAVNEYNSLILNTFPTLDNTGVLSFANSLWMNSGIGFDVYDSFEDGLEDVYDSEIHAYDFAKGPGLINAWCSKKTNGLIPEVLKSLDPNTLMTLVNALYFKGKWDTPFMKENTKPENFINADDKAVEVDMMSDLKAERYLKTDKYALAELPYGNKAFSFQILLPDEGVSLDECMAGLSSDEWLDSQADMRYNHLDFKLPKFKVGLNVSLKEVLKAMGMRKMFSSVEADFITMSPKASHVSFAVHATSFEVDERGSEAAAVTVLGMLESAGPGEEEPECIPFHVNRPFLFILKEISTNVILFVGKVEKLN